MAGVYNICTGEVGDRNLHFTFVFTFSFSAYWQGSKETSTIQKFGAVFCLEILLCV